MTKPGTWILIAGLSTAIGCGELLSSEPVEDEATFTNQGDAAAPSEPATTPDDAGAGDAGFCRDAAFCTDFGVGSLDSGWDPAIAPRGVVDLSTARFVSPPSALHVTLGARDAGAPPENVLLRHPFVDGYVRTLVDVELYVDAPTWNGAQRSIGLNVDGFRLLFGPGYGQLRRDPESLMLDALPTDRWFHLRVVVDRLAGTVSAVVDGKPYAMAFDPTNPVEPAAVNQVRLGIIGLDAAPAISLFYDDLRVERF